MSESTSTGQSTSTYTYTYADASSSKSKNRGESSTSMADTSSRYASSVPESPRGVKDKSVAWATRTGRQTWILLKKNWAVARVSRRSTTVQLVVPVLAILALFILSFAYKENQQFNDSQQPQRSPSTESIRPYPRCISGRLSVGPCISIAWVLENAASLSAGARDLVGRVVERIRVDAGLPTSEVRQFGSRSELDSYLLSHPNSTQGGYEFAVREPAVPSGGRVVEHLSYTIQYNKTSTYSFGTKVDSQEYTLLPMTAAVERALLAELGSQVYTGSASVNDDIEYSLSLLEFARPEEFQADLIALAGPTFVYAALLFNFVIVLGAVVSEKEKHLREAMRLMGLRSLPYWTSWAVTAFVFNVISVFIIIISGAIFQFRFFLENDFRTYFVLFLLFAAAMVPVALFLSVFVSKAATATSLGFIVFLVGTMAQVFQQLVYGESGEGTIYPILASLVPPVLLSKGMFDIASYTDQTDDRGMSWSQRDSTSNFPLTSVYEWMIADVFIFAILLWYADTIASKGERFYFPFSPYYWGLLSRHDASDAGASQPSDEALEALGESGAGKTHDANVHAQLADAKASRGAFAGNDGLKVYGLRKEFTSRQWCGLRKSVFVAVQELVLGVPADSLFVLLGHNGAGKSTSFNMLLNLFGPTAGNAYVFGMSIKTEMDRIRAVMGVCPQHDILWDELTAREHLELYARLKDIPGDEVYNEVEARLADVGLTSVGDVTAGAYSGGMRRRLSTAIAFTADPRIVFLDEPTTGMDPVSRRQVWNLIQAKKAGRVIVLTTHSMEEADVLGDNIGIMAAGRITTIGTARYLKSQYGTGSKITIIPKSESARARIADFVAERLDGIQPDSHVGDLDYVIPLETVDKLGEFLTDFAARKRKLGAVNLVLGSVSLEEVFLRVAEVDHEYDAGSSSTTSA
ncbi:ABC transporter A family member 9 [Thecamonas trahens ATCC 50062]|uniref:ABC transporter A family member 9 n=1 Tax=Thecamonas trahens ATCC 50062 TaxID=461836 RepID=A0A0L0DP95_THETB|nr:ABC transporter A family member 9 [Thecamonas trahens ATCC 50062]KNC54119.1 ABC transporter A family member 9 [Thecamonas trahens ATCC 50062]|eukprot:XP_013753941.1 ABC transporter A family member 9 [Thecamonas trahens ATCC 50062]